jgi:ABC-type bacteriocin/lantibiotic exporter with double-glycine peptidase domain
MREFEPIHVEGWCGVEALQYIAQEEGLWFGQPELAHILGTTHESGTDHSQMFNGAMRIGLQPTQVLGQPIETIAKALPDFHVIVNWMQGENEADDGHYSRLWNVDKGVVYLHDAIMTVEEFNKKWYDFTPEGRVDKWAMIIKRTS